MNTTIKTQRDAQFIRRSGLNDAQLSKLAQDLRFALGRVGVASKSKAIRTLRLINGHDPIAFHKFDDAVLDAGFALQQTFVGDKLKNTSIVF